MTRIFSIVMALFFTVSITSAAEIPAPIVVKVNERIHALLGPMEMPTKKNQGYMVNSVLLIGDTGAIVVDTGLSDEIGTMLGRHFAQLTDKPIKYVINTHHHGDHTLGNAAFPGAKFLSSEICRQLMLEDGPTWVSILESINERKFPNTKIIPADATYPKNTRTELTLAGIKMVFWVPEAAHTIGDMMIWLPDDQVLLSGDVLVNQVTPSFRDAKLKEWIHTLAEIQNLPIETIVPGHGPLMSKQQAAAMHQRMVSLYDGVTAGVKEGLTDSEIRQKLDLGEWKALHNFNEQMGNNINRAYLEIEADNF